MNDAKRYLIPTGVQRMARLQLMPPGPAPAYAGLMAREAGDLAPRRATELSARMRKWDRAVFGPIQRTLRARRLAAW